MMRDHMRIGTLALLLACVAPGTSQAKGIGWPDVIDGLSRVRSKAETCVTSLKREGDKEQIARLRQTYSDAKSDFDGIIAGLVIALAKGDTPEKFDAELESGKRHLRDFCDSVNEALSSRRFSEVAKAAIEPLINAISQAVAALYDNYRIDNATIRQTIRTQLEAATWPEFDEAACSSASSSRAVAAEPLVKTLAEMAHELGTITPTKESIRREVALKEARISLMHEGWKPEWGNYDDFLRWVTEQAARDPAPPSLATAAAIYRGQAK